VTGLRGAAPGPCAACPPAMARGPAADARGAGPAGEGPRHRQHVHPAHPGQPGAEAAAAHLPRARPHQPCAPPCRWRVCMRGSAPSNSRRRLRLRGYEITEVLRCASLFSWSGVLVAAPCGGEEYFQTWASRGSGLLWGRSLLQLRADCWLWCHVAQCIRAISNAVRHGRSVHVVPVPH